MVDSAGGIACGACNLPNEAGPISTVFDQATAQVNAKVREYWGVVRQEITGAALPPSFVGR